MIRLLALLFTFCLAQPASAAEWHDIASPSKYGEPEIIRGELHLPTGDGPFPAVVLMHGCGGLSAAVKQGLDAHAAALNDAGFAAMILDSFGPRDLAGGKVCENVDQLVRQRHARRADAAGAHAFLQTLPEVDGGNIFLMGQSNGAGTAVLAAQPSFAKATGLDVPFRAVAAFYPWCGSFDSIQLTTPLLVSPTPSRPCLPSPKANSRPWGSMTKEVPDPAAIARGARKPGTRIGQVRARCRPGWPSSPSRLVPKPQRRPEASTPSV